MAFPARPQSSRANRIIAAVLLAFSLVAGALVTVSVSTARRDAAAVRALAGQQDMLLVAAAANEVRLIGVASIEPADSAMVTTIDTFLVMEEAAVLAESANVDRVNLVDAYLAAMRRELHRAPAVPSGSVWDRLAKCESNNRWSYNGGSGFDGGLQFHPKTWTAYKLDGYPTYAWQATREQQIAAAERVLEVQGWGAWPACSRKLGLR